MDLDFELAKQKGISSPYAVGFMPYSVKDGRITVDYAAASRQLAMDAAASTAPNIGAPAALYTYIDPRIVQVLFGVTNASKFFAPNKVGSWEQDFATFEVEEIEGNVTAYNDYADGVTTDVNYYLPSRQSYR